MPSTYNGWPILLSDDALALTPNWSQNLARALSDTVGQAPTPPDEVVDTGWVDCTILGGFFPRASAYRPQVRRQGDMVTFRGHMSTRGMTSGTNQILKMPSTDFWPALESRWIGFMTGEAATPIGGWIGTGDGTLYVQSFTPPSSESHFCIITQPWEAQG